MSAITATAKQFLVCSSSIDPGRKPIASGALDQHPPRRTVPGLGDATLEPRATAGMLGRYQTEIGRQLACIGEAGDATEFSHQSLRRH